ncbi:MAG: dihydroxyacetone kinase subunit DhaL [Anaerovoracaceae bacterium]|nr:dihydroxyacetone kinase subunit DhaL [Anaerovoracaceae bacterium]
MMNTAETVKMLKSVADTAIGAREELCKLDSYVGDGDHGFTVERGFSAVKSMLEETDFNSSKEAFEATGDELADTMGGAIGLIIGGLFTGGAEAMESREDFDTEDMYTLLSAGLEEIKLVGGAKEGDRTLIDALSPACDAFKAAMDQGKTLSECISCAADAAEKGAEATADMVAKKGRAKFLQEESKGYVDAGAVTMSKIIRAMSDYISK